MRAASGVRGLRVRGHAGVPPVGRAPHEDPPSDRRGERFRPECVGIETVWFGQNVTAAFATGQARGAALVACAEGGLAVGEYTPRQIKLAVVGEGSAEKDQVQYMVRHLLSLDRSPEPDHAADALAAAICYTTHENGRLS